VGNFAQGFSPEGVAFDIFFCKNVKSPPLALGVNIDRCITRKYIQKLVSLFEITPVDIL
jgi:hypothetical protein